MKNLGYEMRSRALSGTTMFLLFILMESVWLGQRDPAQGAVEPSSVAENFYSDPSTALDGGWRTACLRTLKRGTYGSRSFSVTLIFRGNYNRYESTWFSDESCVHGLVATSAERQFKVVELENYSKVHPIDFSPAIVTVSILDGSIKDQCSGRPRCVLVEAYDIFAINGNHLLMGRQSSDRDGSTSSKRPVDLDSAVIFQKFSP